MKIATTVIAASMILAAPWPIGGNFLYVRTVILVLAAILGIAAALSCLVEQGKFRTTFIWIILPAATLYAFYQTLELSGPISTYPTASRARLLDLVAAISIFFSSVILFREKKTIEPLMMCLAIVGVALSFVGIAQNLGWNGKVLWVYELLFGGKPFGPFVNSNNAACFLILSLAGSFYFFSKLVSQSSRAVSRVKDNLLDIEQFRDTGQGSFFKIGQLLADLDAKHLYCFAAVVVTIAGVFLSYSRGGSISVVFALTVGLTMLMLHSRWAIFLGATILVSCVGVAAWVEQADAVRESIATISTATANSDPRLLHWQDALPYYKKYWLTGSGLGTYQYEYPTFQTHRFSAKFARAESVYLETLAELGFAGIMAIVLTLVALGLACLKLFRGNNVTDRALGIAGFVSLSGVATASFLDFGIYQPANYVVAAILFGVLIGRATRPDYYQQNDNSSPFNLPGKAIRFSLLMVFILACGCSVLPSAAIESRQYAKRQLALHLKRFGADRYRIENARASLQFAEKFLTNDWETQFLLGQCEIFDYRISMADQIQTQAEAHLRATGLAEENIEEQLPTREEFWESTSLINLHRSLRDAEAAEFSQFQRLRQDPQVLKKELEIAWKRFQLAKAMCDRSEKVHFRLAQLSVLMEPIDANRSMESQHLDRALSLAKGYSNLEFSGGLLSLQSGNFEFAAELWSRCLTRSRGYEQRILTLGMELPAKLFFEKVLPQNPNSLLRISRIYFRDPEQKLPNEMLLVHTRRLINQSDRLSESEKEALTGQSWHQAGEHQLACDHFEMALDFGHSDFPWRTDYAESLAEIGRFDDAVRELKLCQLEASEDSVKLTRLIERIKRERVRERVANRNGSTNKN